MDPVTFLSDLAAGQAGSKLRIGMARVYAVDSDTNYTITTGQAVITPASAEVGVGEIIAPYVSEYPPRPGGSCWYVTDGVDRIILGMMAPDGPPTASISLTAATATVTATNYTAVMTTIDYDPWNMATSSSTALQIPADGVYDIQAYAVWGANATGNRLILLRKNGTQLNVNRIAATTAGNPAHSIEMLGYPLRKGDLISGVAQQTSTGNLNLNSFSISANYVGRRRSSTAPELLNDGGFESGVFNSSGGQVFALPTSPDAPWTATGGVGVLNKFVSLDTTVDGTGLYSCRFFYFVNESGTMTAYSQKPITVVPGQVLQLVIRHKQTVNANLVPTLQFATAYADPTASAYGGTSLVGSALNPGTAWATYTLLGTVPAGQRFARLSMASTGTAGVAGATVWVDNISIKEVIR